MSLTATYDPLLSRIRLQMTGAGATATYAVFDRSTDGVTFTTVRGGSAVAIASANASVDDYEFPAGVLVAYRCWTYTAAGVLVDAFVTSITQDLDQVWLKVPAAPYLNTPVVVVDHGDVTRRSRTGLFDVVSRSFPVAVGDVASSVAYEIQLLTETASAERDLDYLFASGEIVLLHLPAAVEDFPGGYFAVGDVSRGSTLRKSVRRVFRIPLTEVAAPGPDVIGSAYTIASMIAEYATVEDVIADNASIGDLLQRVGSPSDVIVS